MKATLGAAKVGLGTLRSASTLATALRAGALAILAWAVLTILTQSGSASRETIFFQHDALWLVIDVVFLAALSVVTQRGLPSATLLRLSRSRWCDAAIALVVAAIAMIGAQTVFQGFAFTQDEVMARFDATIFRHGLSVAPVPGTWRPYIGALQPSLLIPIAGNLAWASSYLPGNAAIRAVLDGVCGLDLASAVLAGIAVLAAGDVARRLRPDRPDVALVTMLFLATSTQFLFNAFTPFAMTAHLALNLVWLSFFLRGGKVGHAAALAVSLLACGLHQLIFHPLFALPFVLQLWLTCRWRLAAVYTVSYGAIGVFWVLYWQLMLAANGLHGIGRAGHGLLPFLGEVAGLLRDFRLSGIDLMAKNITRFLAWQNPLSIVLAGVGVLSLRRLDDPRVALAVGLVLTTLAMFVLLPLQGFGWGYRYLHPFIGSLCLLAGAGWIAIDDRIAAADGRSTVWTATAFAAVFSLGVMLPARAREVEAWVSPYVAAERAIQAAKSDIVIVDANGVGFGVLLVRNDPFFRNRPLVMNLADLTPPQITSLCARYTLTLFDEREAEAFGIMKSERVAEFPSRMQMTKLGCGTPRDASRNLR